VNVNNVAHRESLEGEQDFDVIRAAVVITVIACYRPTGANSFAWDSPNVMHVLAS